MNSTNVFVNSITIEGEQYHYVVNSTNVFVNSFTINGEQYHYVVNSTNVFVNSITIEGEQYHYGVNSIIVFVNTITINVNRITKVKNNIESKVVTDLMPWCIHEYYHMLFYSVIEGHDLLDV